METEEAIRRSTICKDCVFNKHTGMRGRCPGCFARKAVLFLFGHRQGYGEKMKIFPEAVPMSKNPLNGQLTYCEKCGCDLKLKVFLPLGVIDNEGVEYPPHCWQNEGK